ncbi:MAG TPA: Hsp20/alpha crystallin family protein [Kiritimatiellia bacterium]|jgi:HSP20 family molecular chaperone IbpA|nr:Hsp20/alpha crystallin family protein [Kiritimatiellia bacterium]HPO38627.1 Hsp20/alpha crystallin family protein [Kiritimatiellia bacterium]
MSLMKRTEQDVQKMNRVELTPASRVLEGEEAYTLTVELPGVSEKEIELTLENRVLSITAENTLETFKDYALVLHELPEVRYRAAFDLPEHVDTAGIKAANKNGLLILTLPKREEVKPRRIAIAAG